MKEGKSYEIYILVTIPALRRTYIPHIPLFSPLSIILFLSSSRDSRASADSFNCYSSFLSLSPKGRICSDYNIFLFPFHAHSYRPLSSPTFHFLSPYLSSLALMASFARTVPAIYVPGALPPPLPLLASQTDLFTNSIHPVRVFHEELIPTQRTKIPKSLRFNPYVSGLNAVSNTKILLYRIDQRLSQK